MLGAAAAALACPASVRAISAPGLQAHPADDFVESLGVNLHLWPGSPYLARDGLRRRVIPALKELGIRHVRDGLGTDRGLLLRLTEILALGVRATLICDPRHTTPGQVRQLLAQLGSGHGVAMLEGVNEPDINPISVSDVLTFQQDLRREIVGLGIPLASPSVTQPARAADFAAAAPYSDFANLHLYSAGHMPDSGGWGDDGYGSLDWARRRLGEPVAGRKPCVVTECGYHNAVTSMARQRNGHRGVTEAVAAVYLPRQWLHYFESGVRRSFYYELLDGGTDADDPEQNFGLLRHDGSRKPAFIAARNLIAACMDPGPRVPPARLDVSVDGDERLRTCLLQKRGGEFLLAVWQLQPCWDVDRAQPLTAAPQRAVLRLGTPMRVATAALSAERLAWRPEASGELVLPIDVGPAVTLFRLTR